VFFRPIIEAIIILTGHLLKIKITNAYRTIIPSEILENLIKNNLLGLSLGGLLLIFFSNWKTPFPEFIQNSLVSAI